MFHGDPIAPPGLRVGLLGGSFDPPHAGHLHVTRRALAGFGLDVVWWLASPGNPLKRDTPAALARRLAAARRVIAGDRRIVATALEARLGTRYTADTLRLVRARYPGVRFVWLMGADNLASFHRWEHWQHILAQVPVGVVARPGAQVAAGLSPAARAFARSRLPVHAARALPFAAPPAWALLTGPMVEVSSTELRRAGAWQR